MIINHNMNALNAHRNMTGNTASAGKSMEKLSSGLRINRAGDDAAGLAISEKMRGQIRGLDQASRNAQDGISLIQTAEGALNETHNILQRMRELATQSANDTNITEDRSAIKKEMEELTKEIDRIATDTEFNKQTLLDGKLTADFQIGANAGQTITISIGGMDSNTLGLTSGVERESATKVPAATQKALGGDGKFTISGTTGNYEVKNSDGQSIGTVTDAGEITLASGETITLENAVKAGDSFTVKGDTLTQTITSTATADSSKLAAGEYKISGTNLMNGDKVVGKVVLATGAVVDNDGKALTNLTTDYGIDTADLIDNFKFTVKGVSIDNSSSASASIKTLDDAITKVSEQRSNLGAVQNRLEHTTANLNNTSENLTAAESRIRDVDMAKEMMTFSKNNILSQAAQAMLAQANSQPQGVLQLLR